jgi:hypothetical protein
MTHFSKFPQEQDMRNRPIQQVIQLIPSLLVVIIFAAFQYQYLHLDAFSVASQLSMSLLTLKPPPLRADLPWRGKLEWVVLSTAERIAPLARLGGLEHLVSGHLRQLRQRYET